MNNVASETTQRLELTRRFSKGTLANLLTQLIHAAGQLAVIPVFLICWGKELYGEWLVLFAAVGYLKLVDVGVQHYVINRMNQCHAQGQRLEFTRVLHSAFFWSTALSLGLILSVSVFAFQFPVERWLGFTVTDHFTAASVAVFFAVQVVASIPLGLIAGIYRTIGEYPRGVMVANVQRLFFYCVTIGSVWAGGELAVTALMQLLPLCGAALFVVCDLKKRHPWVYLGIRERDHGLALSFLQPSLLFFLMTVSMMLTVQGTSILIGAVVGAGSVVLYATLRTFTNFIRQGAAAVNHALWPDITALESQGRYDTLRAIHQLGVKSLLLLCFFFAIFFHFGGEAIVTLWTQGKLEFDQWLLDVFLLHLIIQGMWLNSSIFLSATNHHQQLAKVQFFSACAGLFLAWLWIERYGLPGVALGVCIPEILLMAWFVPREACALIGQDAGKFCKEVFLKGLLLFIALGLSAAWLWGLPVFGNFVLRLGFMAAAVAALGYILAWSFWFDGRDKEIIRKVLSPLFPVKRLWRLGASN